MRRCLVVFVVAEAVEERCWKERKNKKPRKKYSSVRRCQHTCTSICAVRERRLSLQMGTNAGRRALEDSGRECVLTCGKPKRTGRAA
jgi:hypothetical protein